MMRRAAVPPDDVEKGLLHIAYEYLYASSLMMMRSDGRAFQADVREPNIANFIVLGTQATVSAETDTAIKFVSRDNRPAAFAYKAGRLTLEDSRWTFRPEQVRRSLSGQAGRPYLPARGVALHVEE